MSRRLKKWIGAHLLAIVCGLALVAFSLPYVPLVHGTTADEVERLAAWLELKPGANVADLGTGDGTFAIALAQRVGPSGHVYATELDDDRLAAVRHAAALANLTNVTVVKGAVSSTSLPDGCCDALFNRNVYHHLTDPAAINADIRRALRPGGRLLVIDFEPVWIMKWIADRPETAERHGGHGTPTETVIKEVAAANFQLVRGPMPWRGRLYAVLFQRP